MTKPGRNRSILYTVLALSAVFALPAASLASPKKTYRPSTSETSPSHPPGLPSGGSGDAFNVTSAKLVAITTDEEGKVETIVVRKGDELNSYPGCGIALTNVPHLVDALKDKRRFGLRVEKGCIQRISVGNE